MAPVRLPRHQCASRWTSPASAGRAGTSPRGAGTYLIPASGEPRALVHAIESHALEHLPGTTERYSGRAALEVGAAAPAPGHAADRDGVLAEAAPSPTSRASTPARSSSCGNSASRLPRRAISSSSSPPSGTTRRSSLTSPRPKSCIGSRIAPSTKRRAASRTACDVTEFEIQQLMAGWFAEEGLVSDSAPVVAAEKNAGDPHYLPTASTTRTIGKDEVLLLDLWGKLDQPGAVFADITWVGYTGREVPASHRRGVQRGQGRARRGGRARPAADPGRPGDPRLRGRPRVDGRAARRRVRRRHPAPHGPQPRRVGARQRRQHGRLRDARRSAAAARHGLHDRAGRVLRGLRDTVGNQHDRGRPGCHGHRAAAIRDNGTVAGCWRCCREE